MTAAAPSVHRRDLVEVAGRAGLVARGAVYVVMAALAALIARGEAGAEADTTGALRTIGAQPYGKVLLIGLAICLAGYAVWRLAEAVTGRTSTDPDAGIGQRLLSAGRAVMYVGLALTALRLLSGGGGKSGSEQQQSWTARVLEWPAGKWIVVLVGLAVLAAAAYQVHMGVTAKFLERLDIGGNEERSVRLLGTVGYVGRGVSFALVGLFVVQAAVRHDASKSQGLDGALGEVAAKGYGPPLLLLLGLGLLAFGLYSFAEARWRRIPG